MAENVKVDSKKGIQEASLHKKDSPVKVILLNLVLYVPLVFWTVVTLFPFWYMLVLATKGRGEIFNYPPPFTLSPNFLQGFIDNYNSLLSQIPFWRNLWNSVYIAVMGTVLMAFFSSLGGYGFAMYEFKGKKGMFLFMLITMMIPSAVGIVPYFIMMKAFGWLNTARAIYIPGMASAFGIFLMRQYIFSSIPVDLVDAARVDGCSEFGIYWRIVVPLITPVIGSLSIINFLGMWNSYMGPLIVLREPETYTIPVALGALKGLQSVDYGAIMVGTVMAVFPLLIVFFFFSKMIIAKVTEGALKG